MQGLLIVAATERELCGHPGLVCGVGPVEAAAATARALARDRPARVLQVGIAGARGLAPGTIVVGSEAVYADLRASVPVVRTVTPDPALVARVRTVLPHAPLLPIVTSAAVSEPCNDQLQGRVVEAMEGFGVLRACELAGVPAVEVRAVSNEIGEQDRSRWRVDDALSALRAALPALVGALGR